MSKKASSGIPGLDEVLRGGLPRNRLYLIEGSPGTGKTTLGLQFLLEGARAGEKGLYVTLSESADELRDVAASHGWTLDSLEMYELESSEDRLQPEEQYTVFQPEEVELTETANRIYELVERVRPRRMVFDSLSEVRLLARNALRFRRQLLSLKHFATTRDCTVLMMDDRAAKEADAQLQSLCHGVLQLKKCPAEYGPPRRKINVTKMRGVDFRDGDHDIAIRQGGIAVYPRLVAAEHRAAHPRSTVLSGLRALDELLGGGLERSTAALILGAAGAGKSTLSALFACTAAQRGEASTFFIFEESLETFVRRATGMSMPISQFIENGLITVHPVDPAELSPGQFSLMVRDAVEKHDSKLIVIDSLTGYLNAMPSDSFLLLQMHELVSYLAQKDVLTLLCVAQHGFIGDTMQSPVDLSYLADSVILLRFFEMAGQLRQAISVMKKRSGPHERSIRELTFTPSGPVVSETLQHFEGIMTGVPRLFQNAADLRLPSQGISGR